MIKKAPVLLLAALLLCFFACGCGKSADSNVVLKSANPENKDNSFESISENGIIKVAVNPDDSPYVVKNSDGSYSGFLIDVMESTARLLELETEYAEIGSSSVIDMLSEGEADVVLNGYSVADTSNKSVYWVEPSIKNHHIIVCLKSSEFDSKDDLNGRKIGVTSDTLPEVTAQSDIKIDNDSLVKYGTQNDALNGLLDGKIDALVIEDADFYSNDSFYKGNFKILDEIVSVHVHSLGVKKDNMRLAEVLSNSLKELFESGELGEISKKHFGVDITG